MNLRLKCGVSKLSLSHSKEVPKTSVSTSEDLVLNKLLSGEKSGL